MGSNLHRVHRGEGKAGLPALLRCPFFVLVGGRGGNVFCSAPHSRWSAQFHMLGDEVLVHQQADVELLADRQRGSLCLTNYRLVFVPSAVAPGSGAPSGPSQSVPLGCVAQVDLHYNVMRVLCKNMRLLEFCYSNGPDLTTSSILLSSVQIMGGALVPQLVLMRQYIVDQVGTPFAQRAAFAGTGASVAPVYGGIAAEMRRQGASAEWRVTVLRRSSRWPPVLTAALRPGGQLTVRAVRHVPGPAVRAGRGERRGAVQGRGVSRAQPAADVHVGEPRRCSAAAQRPAHDGHDACLERRGRAAA